MIMMQGTYYKEWSSVLNREMEFKVYGSAGVPVLALPARGGRFYDWENNGMPDAIAQLLNEGKVQLFCADSIDGEAVLNGDAPVRRRAEMEEKYFVYLTAELAPRILTLNNAKKGTRIWTAGVDLGAYHAVHCRLRRPTLFASTACWQASRSPSCAARSSLRGPSAFPASMIWPASGAARRMIWYCAPLPCCIWAKRALPTS